MKKFVTFVLVLSLGLFCAVGCQPKTPEKKATTPPAPEAKDVPKTDEAAPKTEEPKADEMKSEEKAPEMPAEEK